ncbi:hypothetical protein [Agromyces salentinus]|uniref:Exo-alpha-sialidase n=1 Tax=Agromyces salentinus TaxID=269421 RepID=A0ABN2MWQ8_9MICO|nr:hypothetical protein [Agromyces salentinus]
MPRSETPTTRFVAAPWAVAAIVVFVLVDAALVWWAITSVRSDASPPQGEVLPTLPPPASESPSEPTSSPSPAADADAVPTVVRPTVVLAALDANLAYRGVVGRCPDAAAALEVSVDGGATWTPAYTAGLTDLQSIDPSDADIVTMIARDPTSCGVGGYRSFVQGDDWEPAGELEPTWYLDGAQVVGPAGASTPCDGPVQVAATSTETATVFCESGKAVVTNDSGASWSVTELPPGALAITATPELTLVAVTGDGCRGIRIAKLASDAAPGACLEADLTPGTTVIDVASDGTVWAYAGGVLARSTDGGATW